MGIILLKKHYFCLDEQIRSLTRPKRLITTIKKQRSRYENQP